jgi:hypothetical protein
VFACFLQFVLFSGRVQGALLLEAPGECVQQEVSEVLSFARGRLIRRVFACFLQLAGLVSVFKGAFLLEAPGECVQPEVSEVLSFARGRLIRRVCRFSSVSWFS